MSFKIGGSFAGVDNPVATFIGFDTYGTNIKGTVYGPFEAWRFSWSIMTNSQWNTLYGRVESVRGKRVPITVPLFSPTNWKDRYGEAILMPGFYFEGDEVLNVTIEVVRVSDDADS
jgi:hypothetical protein